MLWVSWRLFACSRPISSWRLTSDSEVTCLSSSIFASSSAIGCSKSRNDTAMRAEPTLTEAAVGGECAAGRRGRRRVHHLHRAAAHQGLQLLEQLAAGAHGPFLP